MAITERVTAAAAPERIHSRLDAPKPASHRTAMPQFAPPQTAIPAVASRSPAPTYAPCPPVVLMAAAAGLAIANIYYNQPVLGLIAGDLRSGHAVSLLPTATQAGYALGILLLMPLGDQVDRRRLILLQGAGLTGTLAAAALAPGLPWLIAASVLVGMFATIAQQIVPFAAELSVPNARGRTIGAVMSGLLVGILLARALSGFVGAHLGWRAVFWIGAGVAAAMTATLTRLPHSRPATREPYMRLLASLWHLALHERELRRAAVTQGLLFAGFSAFWTILALLLRTPAFKLGSDAAGLFGMLALGGVALAPLAGRFADARGPRGVVRLGAGSVLAAFLLMAVHTDLATLAVGVVLMDAGVQVAMVSNQAIIYVLAGEARGRFNTVFIAVMFAVGAAGSAGASFAWDAGGWPAVMGFAAALAGFALLVQFAGPHSRSDGIPGASA